MRELLKFDSYDIMQRRVINKGLKLNHLFLLDYLLQFFSSGRASRKIDEKGTTYYLITCNKIVSDLPILNIKKRRALMLLRDLEKSKFITIKQLNSRSPKYYISINL